MTLAYHNVVRSHRPPIFADASLHLPLHQFREQLDAITAAGLRVVRLDSPPPSALDEPQVSITFDDAYAGAINLAVPELAKRGFPATIFVAPGILGAQSCWCDRLANPSFSAVMPRLRNEVLTELNGDGDKVESCAADRGWTLQAASAIHRIATASELGRALVEYEGLTVGAHTWRHVNLASLSPHQVRQELVEPLEWLKDQWNDQSLPWLAYPYGLESAAVRREVAKVGYVGALLVRGGWDTGESDRFAIPRINVTSRLSTKGFQGRLAGMI